MTNFSLPCVLWWLRVGKPGTTFAKAPQPVMGTGLRFSRLTAQLAVLWTLDFKHPTTGHKGTFMGGASVRVICVLGWQVACDDVGCTAPLISYNWFS